MPGSLLKLAVVALAPPAAALGWALGRHVRARRLGLARLPASRDTKGGARGGVRPGPAWALGPRLLVCLFCGAMIAAVGGAAYPPMIEPAFPLVCEGTVRIDVRPTRGGHTVNMYCVGADGREVDRSGSLFGVAMLLYAGVLFAGMLVAVPLVALLKPRVDWSVAEGEEAPRAVPTVTRIVELSGREVSASTPAERLRQLRALRDQDLITDADYEAKKAEVLETL